MEQPTNLTDKRKTARAWFFVLLPFAILLALFAFRSRFIEFGSRQMLRSRDNTEARQFADSARQWFDYTKNGSTYQYTLLEFGAKGCITCKKMEQVTRDIEDKFPRKVNARLVNVTEAKGQKLAKHFGIVTIPTQVILDKRGKETFRHTGYIPAEELEKRFK